MYTKCLPSAGSIDFQLLNLAEYLGNPLKNCSKSVHEIVCRVSRRFALGMRFTKCREDFQTKADANILVTCGLRKTAFNTALLGFFASKFGMILVKQEQVSHENKRNGKPKGFAS